jgi:hypothetical protein
MLAVLGVSLLFTAVVAAGDWRCSYNNATRRTSCFVSGTLQLGIANTSSLPLLSVIGVAPSTAVLLRTGDERLGVANRRNRFNMVFCLTIMTCRGHSLQLQLY